MNRERLLELRKTLVWLRDTPELPDGMGFDMSQWRREKYGCNTTMCLAGWHVELNPNCGLVFQKSGPWDSICISIVGKPLQINDQEGDQLYGPGATALSPLMEYFDISEETTALLFNSPVDRLDRKGEATLALECLDKLLKKGESDGKTDQTVDHQATTSAAAVTDIAAEDSGV